MTDKTRTNGKRVTKQRNRRQNSPRTNRHEKKVINIDRSKRRAFLIRFVIVLGFFFVFGRAYYIVIVHGDEYIKMQKSTGSILMDNSLPATRGLILDRNKASMALGTIVYNIILDPNHLHKYLKPEEIEKVLKTTSEILELNYADLNEHLAVGEDGKLKKETAYVVIAKSVSQEIADKLKEQKLKGIWLEQDTKRSYADDTLAAQILGFVRGGTAWGLEAKYNNELTGVRGREYMTFENGVNVQKKILDAQNGYTLVTTLDQNIQRAAEEAVAEAVREHNPKDASVIVMNPNTGEVLAMAQSKTFNLNDPMTPVFNTAEEVDMWNAFTDEEKINYLNQAWKNLNTLNAYEPGSIFKPITVAAALEENLISPDEVFFCSGSKVVADRTIGCHSIYGHKEITVSGAIASSCNVALMDIAEKLGRELFYKYQREFGYGEKTGIDAFSETSALDFLHLPSQLNQVELATSSFGQTFNATPIQSINAIAAIANGGNLMQPYIVSQIIDESGKIIKEMQPYVRRRVISESTADYLRQYMVQTIEVGTGKRAKIEGYQIAGKTGTAETGSRLIEDRKYSLSMVAYLPADDPQVIALIVIDEPEDRELEAGAAATPIMKTLLESSIRILGISPSYITGEDTNVIVETEVNLPNYAGQDVLVAADNLDSLGLKPKIVGHGNTVKSQVPDVNRVPKGVSVLLYTEEAEASTSTITQVPSVIGQTYNEAFEALTLANLIPAFEGELTSEMGTMLVGTQSVPANKYVKKETEVILTILK